MVTNANYLTKFAFLLINMSCLTRPTFLCRIFRYVPKKLSDVVPLLNVCSVWNETIMQYSNGMWNDIANKIENELEYKRFLHLRYTFLDTSLMNAASREYYMLIDILSKAYRSYLGFAINTFSQRGDAKSLKILIKNGGTTNYNYNCALMGAVTININDKKRIERLSNEYDFREKNYNDNAECIEILSKICNVNAKEYNGNTALMIAAETGHTKGVEILSKVCDVNMKNRHGHTALIIAAKNGHKRCVEILINMCDVNAKDCHGNTILMLAAKNGYTKCVEIILKVCNNVNEKNHGNNALMLAIKNGHRKCVEILSTVCDVNAKDCNGNTMLILAAQSGSCVDLFCKICDVNAKNYSNKTALMYSRNKESIEFLLDEKCDLNATDNNGITALEYARRIYKSVISQCNDETINQKYIALLSLE